MRTHVLRLSPLLRLGVLSCPVVSCRVLSCPVVSCRVLSCPVVSCPVLLFMSCRVVSCRVVSCRVVSCRVVSCRVVSCRVLSCAQVCRWRARYVHLEWTTRPQAKSSCSAVDCADEVQSDRYNPLVVQTPRLHNR
jgi:hypothetical protein